MPTKMKQFLLVTVVAMPAEALQPPVPVASVTVTPDDGT
jgi:hypothetical protein